MAWINSKRRKSNKPTNRTKNKSSCNALATGMVYQASFDGKQTATVTANFNSATYEYKERKVYLLEDWTINFTYRTINRDTIECMPIEIAGKTKNHPEIEDDELTVIKLIGYNGMLIDTPRGTFKLGAMSSEYFKWLTENDFPFDCTEPVKIVRKRDIDFMKDRKERGKNRKEQFRLFNENLALEVKK